MYGVLVFVVYVGYREQEAEVQFPGSCIRRLLDLSHWSEWQPLLYMLFVSLPIWSIIYIVHVYTCSLL